MNGGQVTVIPNSNVELLRVHMGSDVKEDSDLYQSDMQISTELQGEIGAAPRSALAATPNHARFVRFERRFWREASGGSR